MAAFFRSLSAMVGAGIPLPRALSKLGLHAEEPRIATLCQMLHCSLAQGLSLSQAARLQPAVFSRLHVGLLQVAEVTGGLTLVLRRLADYEEKRLATLHKLQRTFGYPAALLALCMTALVLGPPLLLEGHFQLMRDLRVEVPLLTRGLMGLSTLLRTPWPYLAALLALGFALPAARRALRHDPLLCRITGWLLRLRAIGTLVRTVLVARFARALAIQLEAGVPVTQALSLAGAASGNPAMQEVAEQAVRALVRGRSVSNSLKATRFFPPMFLAMVKTGEESGDLPRLLAWTADAGDLEVDCAIEGVAVLAEPLIMLLMGLVVGTMVLATLLPLSHALQAL